MEANLNPLDFWQWAYSDFLSNAQRGVLAEYIVAKAIGATERLRVEWDAYDVIAPDSTKIEVKSSAYLQTWQQKQHSKIIFDIALKTSWLAETNTYVANQQRSADVYVFCVFAETDRAKADPLNMEQWFFLVCSTRFLNEQFKSQKTVALSSLEKKGLQRIPFDELEEAITEAGKA